MFIFNSDICCWWNLCHLGLQNRSSGVDVCDANLFLANRRNPNLVGETQSSGCNPNLANET